MGKYASKVVAQAQTWLGCKESDGTHKQIIDVYNSHKPFARGYAMKYTDAWCAAFVSAVSIKLGYTDIMPTECNCYYMIELYKKLGRWIENENRTPNSGDILFYDWQDDGVGDNKGVPDHVGIVEKVSGNTITVIEGNYKDGVYRRTLKVNGKNIRGYGLPKYDIESTTTININSNKNRIDTVVEVQKWLNDNYASDLATDNIYGRKTKAALTKALQIELGFIGKDVDGIYGSKTKAAVKRNNLRNGSDGSLVKVLQGFLVCNGYSDAYVDGAFGSGTDKSLRKYQEQNGLTVDGVAGSGTFKTLCV